jgi:membrane-bound serine protease (ClpP class)
MIRNVNLDFGDVSPTEINNAIATVLFSLVGFGVLLYFFSSRFIKLSLFQKIVLHNTIAKAPGIQRSNVELSTLIGQQGIAHTALRPMGRVQLNGVTFEAKTDGDFVDSGRSILVKSIENQYLVVKIL